MNTRNVATGWDIDYLPPGNGERNPTVVLHADGDEATPVLSRDGRLLLYAHGDPGDIDYHVYVASYPDMRDARQVSNDSAGPIRWNANASEVLYFSHNTLISASVVASAGKLQVSPARKLFEIRTDCNNLSLGACFDITPDGTRLLVIDSIGSPAPIAINQNWTSALKK